MAGSMLACLLIVLTADRHLHLTARRSFRPSVQSVHTRPAPQIGGIALILALLGGLAILQGQGTAEAEVAFLAMMVLGAGLPVLLTGLVEDVGHGVRPALRLLAAFASAILAMELTGTRLVHGGFEGGDALLAVLPFAIAFTIFATGGATHAFNLVDGVHGFALGTGIVVSGAMAVMAILAGDGAMASVALLAAGALAGVFLWNFPFGRIFLGDMGAYGIGYFLSWTAVILLFRNPEISPWAMLLVFFWPILETVFSIGRRLLTRRPFGEPDRLHFHHIVLRLIDGGGPGRAQRGYANPMTSVMLLPAVTAIAGLGILSMTDTTLALLLLLTVAIAYTAVYLGLFALLQGQQQRRASRRPTNARAHAPTDAPAARRGHDVRTALAADRFPQELPGITPVRFPGE